MGVPEGLGDELVEINQDFAVESVDALISSVFPSIISLENVSDYRSSSILCPKNDHCFELNNRILCERVSGEFVNYISVDKVCTDDEEDNFIPPEYLHSITPSGMPPH